jgi:hypothetical protein
MSADNQDQEAYYDKQFEEYLRMNPEAVEEAEVVAEVEPEEDLVAEVTRCRCDDSDPEYITCCSCEYTEWEIYSFRYKSSVYCNQCAFEVCGILIDKPQYAFNIDDDVYKFNKVNKTKYSEAQYTIFVQFKKKYDLTVDEAFYYIQACHCCANQIQDFGAEFCSDKCEQYFNNDYAECIYKQSDLACKLCIYNDKTVTDDYTISCDRCLSETLYNDSVIHNEQLFCEGCAHEYEKELLAPYSEEQAAELSKYAEKHNLTIKEAIDYQSHCHCCGNEVTNPVFDENNHQYCKKRCFEHCEDYRYECSRGKECKVCEIWEYRARRDSLSAYDMQLSDCEPVLATIDAFKELKVYNQVYECLGDMTEYFGDLAFYGDDNDPDLYY